MVNGGMAERSKAAVLKTVSGVTHSGVRIPLPPPLQGADNKQFNCLYFQLLASLQLLGHKSRKTTEKYYVALTKKRMEKAIEARRRTWDADTVELPSVPAGAISE